MIRGPVFLSKFGSAWGIRTPDLRLERAVSWASRRTRHAALTNSGAQIRFKATSCYQRAPKNVNRLWLSGRSIPPVTTYKRIRPTAKLADY